MREFKSGNDVQAFLERVDVWIDEIVTVFLIGGTALTIHGLGGRTDDIDLAFYVPEHFDHVHGVLTHNGFVILDEPTVNVDAPGRTVLLHHESEGFRVDLFDRQIVGKVTITAAMKNRASEFWTGDHLVASVLSAEDLFLLKAVAGGDVDADRHTDLTDLVRLAQTSGFDFETVLSEIENQRPFNTGVHEAQLLRDGAHPLLSIDISVSQLSGLPQGFKAEINSLATACQAEKRILTLIESGVHHIDEVIKRSLQDVKQLEDDHTEIVEAAIDRLERKSILRRVDDTRYELVPDLKT